MSDKVVKIQFRAALQPMIELFEHKKEVLSQQDWENFILLTKKSVLNHPDQFLGGDLPLALETEQIVDEIFLEYLENKLTNA